MIQDNRRIEAGFSDYSDRERTDQRINPSPSPESVKKKGWQVAKIWDRHHEITRQLLLGKSQADIARDMNITPQIVSAVANSPVIQDQLTLLRAARDAETVELSRDIRDLAPKAFLLIQDAIETGEVLGRRLAGREILREANSLLDRELGKAIQRVDSRNLNATLTQEDIDEIKQLAQNMTSKED